MALTTISETILSSFRFKRDSESYEASITSRIHIDCGKERCDYEVSIIDDDGNILMKEQNYDFLEACDIYDRLSILVEKFIIK
ncbi:hypothetical protein QD57_001429 [Salmonella enterica subsp. enterica]|uniref:Uncharacterized protein n=1 Tax=Salmonella enterica TaxID=28901 RepID=A0A5U5UUL4_SALER|nr:hypothetical protein [Salmonella enterica subsp. enterica]EBQ6858928.1 hypothetical protein [Salmonella enterica]EBX7003307.1 hypothetical protein [Salmonella enterica subsp. enterica serovar Brunei]ECC3110672.1 hypothetical protein [Salmonella enterica subsp. enterica]ECG3042703.1 hypothetical protein [Salmonella enterica subsp. enterica serovar Brunei]